MATRTSGSSSAQRPRARRAHGSARRSPSHAAPVVPGPHRGRPPALDRIDLDISGGGITALVGPNGAGKSTLIRCFLGFERPTAGFVTVDGIDPARQRTTALARIGYVGQEMGLYRQLTAAEHLELATTLRAGFDRAVAAERRAARDIPLDVPTAELSGGQQAQVALSLALGTNAPVLLLDEPVARLDPLARMAFLAALRDAVRAEGGPCCSRRTSSETSRGSGYGAVGSGGPEPAVY